MWILQDLKYRNWLFLNLALTLVAAICATGYHHPDEYMQILEFANYKLGNISGEHLPWEFHETMRPWFQPWLFFLLNKLSSLLRISNPFVIWSIFRFLHGVVGWIATVLLAQYLLEQKTILSDKFKVGLCAFLFFIPWIYTRASSESLSASLLIISFVLALKKTNWIFSGFLAGLAFSARYQVGFMILGFGIWSVCFNRDLKKQSTFVVGLVVAIVIGLCIDSWGYGRFVFTPYHYFYQNVVLNKAAQWGVKPLHYYLVLMQSHGMFVHSLAITATFIVCVGKHLKNPFVYSSLIFVIVHSLVGHKEMRFLFPVAMLSPVYVALAADSANLDKRFKLFNQFLIITNFIALFYFCMWPSRTEVRLQNEIYDLSVDRLVVVGRNPYSLGDNPMEYTKPLNLNLEVVSDPGQLSSVLTTGLKTYVVTSQGKLENSCEKVWSAFPDWIEERLSSKILERAGAYKLYSCQIL